jgi:hypothetical protein
MALHKIISWKNEVRMKRNNFMEQILSWATNNRSDTKEIPNLLYNPKVILPFSQEPSTGPYPEWKESSPQPHVLFLLRTILTLASHLYLGLPNPFGFSD